MADWNGARDSALKKNDERMQDAQGAIILNLEDLIDNKSVPREARSAVMEGFAKLTGMPPDQLLGFFSSGVLGQAAPPPSAPAALGAGGPAAKKDAANSGDVDALNKQVSDLSRCIGNMANAIGLPMRQLNGPEDLNDLLAEVRQRMQSLQRPAVDPAALAKLEEVASALNPDFEQMSKLNKAGKLQTLVTSSRDKVNEALAALKPPAAN